MQMRMSSIRVLIVAKCIVNKILQICLVIRAVVLIVAKCIVNAYFIQVIDYKKEVLIVAKCIVNFTLAFTVE